MRRTVFKHGWSLNYEPVPYMSLNENQDPANRIVIASKGDYAATFLIDQDINPMASILDTKTEVQLIDLMNAVTFVWMSLPTNHSSTGQDDEETAAVI